MTTKVVRTGRDGVASRSTVPRRRKPLDLSQAETQLSFMVPTWVLEVADAEAEKLSAEVRMPVSRSAVVRRWLEDAAKRRKLGK